MSSAGRSRVFSRTGGAWLPAVLAALSLAALALLVWHLWSRNRELDAQLGQLRETVAGMTREMARISQESRAAHQRAQQAQQKAQVAGEERTRAEQATARAEQASALAEEASARARRQTLQAREELQRARQEAEQARAEADRVRRQREDELNRLQESLSRIVETRRTALGLVMNLGSEFVQFDFDKAELRPQNRELLARIAGVLLTSDRYRVQVYGHTDDVGSEGYNLDLSRRRALAVRDYLVEAGLDPSIIVFKGLGKSNPLVPGTSPQARQKNRRVEIGIVDAVVSYGGALPPAPD